MKEMVVGLLFDNLLDNVLLIKKLAPSWQGGLLNGVGGKVENGETPYNAMVREFEEEAGATVTDWKLAVTMLNPVDNTCIFVYYSIGDVEWKQMEEEELYSVETYDLPEKLLVPNLYWIIPFCKFGMIGQGAQSINLVYDKRG